MPARRTSKALKAVTGRSSNLPGARPVELVAPKWMTGPAKAWHKHFARVLADLSISREADAAAVQQLAHAAEECEKIRAELAKLPGLTYVTTSPTGGEIHRPYPQVAMLEVAAKRFRDLLKECGLTPASANRTDPIPDEP